MVAVSTLCASAALVPVSRLLARRLGVMDPPGERKIHAVPMPRLGGVAVFLSFMSVVACGYLLLPLLLRMELAQALLGEPLDLLREAPRVKAKLASILMGAALCFGVGLIDDALGKRFPAWAKASGQLLAALLVAFADVRTLLFPAEWLNVLVTLVWLVGITNAFNLLDNMDGLCRGSGPRGLGRCSSCTPGPGRVLHLPAAGRLHGQPARLPVLQLPSRLGRSWATAAASSSAYVMGSLTLLERYVSRASSTLFPVLMPVLVLAVPILDTATVVVIRLRERRPIYVGDRRHLSHRLVALGFSQRAAVSFLYLMTFALGLGAASLTNASFDQSVLILLHSLGCIALILWLLFHERPV